MNAWPSTRSIGGRLGIVITAVLGAMGLGLLAAAAWRIYGLGIFDFLGFLFVLLALLPLALALLCAYHTYGYYSLGYALDRNGLLIRWAGTTHVVPLGSITRLVPETTLPAGERPGRIRGFRWPGLVVGAIPSRTGGPVLAYATAPAVRRLLVQTATISYLISPVDPPGFVAEFERRRTLGPTQVLAHETVRAPFTFLPLFTDSLALALVGLGFLLNLALFGYLAAVYPTLPGHLALHWNAAGDPDRIGAPAELLLLPQAAFALWVLDLAVASWIHAHERVGAIFLYFGAVAVQLVFWAAVLTILLRAE